VEVTRASLAKVVAEQLLAHVAHKKSSPKLLAYCKLYYEAPAPASREGNAPAGTQVVRLFWLLCRMIDWLID
jgi:hypothetical protein